MSIEATITVHANGELSAYSQEDVDAIRSLKPGTYRVEIRGTKRERSLAQLRLFWACCRQVAENSGKDALKTAEDVERWIKTELKWFRGYIVDRSGVVHVDLRSISFAELPHLEACNFFERAWPLMAEVLGTTVEELHANTRELEGIEDAKPWR